jgi:DNA-binding GntR family transcriptional regulator
MMMTNKQGNNGSNGGSGRNGSGSKSVPVAQPLVERVYEDLLGKIQRGQYPPGTPLREVDLADQLGVSRTPVREAISRLTEYGVVETRPNRSAVVRRLTWADPGHIHQIREALEGLTAELACGRLTAADFARLDALAEAARDPDGPDFYAAFDEHDVALHRLIATRAGNPLITREVRRLQDLTILIEHQLETVLLGDQRIDDDDRRHMKHQAWEQHVRIVEALRSGDPAASRRAMVDHLRASCELLTRMMPKSHW